LLVNRGLLTKPWPREALAMLKESIGDEVAGVLGAIDGAQHLAPGQSVSEPFDAAKLCKVSIERANRQVASFSGKLDHKAVRESQLGSPSELDQCRRNSIGTFETQRLMLQQHFDRFGESPGFNVINRRQHPARFGQHQARYPRPGGNKRLCLCHLPRVVTSDQAHENIGVNGAHVALSQIC
jgi:hypothetical protein